MIRFQLINILIKENNYKTYLEIGVHRGDNIKKIVCDIKDSVDPYINDKYDYLEKDQEYPVTYKTTSDYFFENIAPNLNYKYDIIFIDGLHLTEQVDKDVENSLKYLNDNGTIVLHDCNPIEYDHQIVPRIYEYWNGDVWKSIIKLRNRKDLNIFVIDSDTGLGVITKNPFQNSEILEKSEYSWEYFDKNRIKLLNIISSTDFIVKIYKNKI